LRASARDVRLQGTAFFVVQRDGRAFTVHTPDAAVRVLGTRFEVRSTDGSAASTGTRVAVEEGRVAVTAAGAARARGHAVELRAGDRVTVTKGAVEASAVRRVAVDRVASWRTGGLAALDEPLDAVLAELSRRFGVDITHAPDIDGAVSISLFYPDMPPLDTVLADLCTAQGLAFERTARGYHIARSDSRSQSRRGVPRPSTSDRQRDTRR
jgi:ferric-dicitrate binding protein FerR (iron transport regulator)